MNTAIRTISVMNNSAELSAKDKEFIKTAREILSHERVKLMKNFTQHGDVSCYQHCMMVCLYAYMYAKKLNMKIDVKALVRGALLHDFFLYDWHDQAFTPDGLHGFSHPVTAERNARNTFPLTEKERKIIYNHMWPLTFTKIPDSKEAWLVCMADKYCSLKETLLKNPY